MSSPQSPKRDTVLNNPVLKEMANKFMQDMDKSIQKHKEMEYMNLLRHNAPEEYNKLLIERQVQDPEELENLKMMENLFFRTKIIVVTFFKDLLAINSAQ